METFEIAGHTLEYIDETHNYLVDGICVPSITQILKIKFGNKYNGVPKAILNKAAEQGTAVHKAIEDYEQKGIDNKDCQELKDYKFLKKSYKFECKDNEVPIILFKDDEPIAAGRLDLVLQIGDKTGLGDIKRTSVLDKDYLAYQLNLYRIGYRQSYGIEAEFLKGLHLRNGVRKFHHIPINENMAWELVNKYMEEK